MKTISNISRSRSAALHRGFSLVELLVVLAIASLVAVMLTMNWNGVVSAGSVTDSLETLIELDRQTRRHAITHGRDCRVKFDLRKNLITVTRWQQDREFQRQIQLNLKARMVEVSAERNELTIDRFGSGPTYYAKISGNHENHRWIVFAGGTGQHHVFESESDVKKFLQDLRSAGVNAG